MSEIIERAARAAFLSAWVYGGQPGILEAATELDDAINDALATDP